MPPDVQKCQEWINGTRKILGMFDAKKLVQRNTEIALLLKDKEIVGSNAFNDFKDTYEDLATRAFNISQGSSGKRAKKDVEEIANELRLLKKKVRLAAAQKDPTSTKKVQAELLTSLKKEPFYREKRERVTKTMGQIAKMPGTHEQVKALKDMLDAADACEPDYEKALAKLTMFVDLSVNEHEGLRLHLEEAKKVSAKFGKTAGGDEFQKELAAARQAVRDYQKVAGVSDGRGVAAEREAINAALRLLDSPTPDVKKATTEVQAVVTRLKKKTGDLTDLKDDLDGRVGDITDKVRNLVEYAPLDVGIDIQARQRTARALWENQQFEPAKTAWDDLERDAKQLLQQYEPAYKQWLDHAKEIEEKRVVLPKAVREHSLSGAANYVQSLIDKRIGAELLPLHKYGEACMVVGNGRIIESLDELTEQLKNPANANFTIPELKYRAEVEKATITLQKELDSIKEETKKLGEKGGDIGPFKDVPAQLLNSWYEGTAADGPNKPDLKFLLGAVLGECQNQKDLIARDSTTGLDQSKKNKKTKEAEAEFDKAQEMAEDAIEDLIQYNLPNNHRWLTDSPSLTDLRSDYQAMVDDSKKGIYAPATKLEKIATDCENKKKLIENDLKKLREAAAVTAADLKKQLDKAEKTNSSYKTFYAALRDRVDAALGRTNSGVLTQVEKGSAELNKIALPPPTDYQKVDSELNEVESLLSNDDLKSYQPEAYAVFNKRVSKELKPRIKQLSPAEAEKEILAFQQEIKTSTKRAEDLKDIREKVKQRAAAAKLQLEDIKTSAPKLYKSLSKRLDKVKEPDKAAVDQANLELATIETLLKTRTNKTQLDKLEKKSVSDEFEMKREKAAFEGSWDVFSFGVQVEADNLYNETPDHHRNKDVYKQIGDVAQQARKFYEKKNYPAANQELLKAVNLAKYFLANPEDRASASRKHLIRLNGQYKAAVSSYLKQLSDLEAALKTAEDDNGAIDSGPVLTAMRPLFSLFGANLFDSPVDKLAKPAETVEELAEHRTHKEIALKNVRLCETALNSHHVLAHVVANPIKPVSVAPLRAALLGLTGALQSS
jgi:hypothetical protein